MPPNGAQNPASGAKRVQKSISPLHFWGVLEPTCFQYRPLTLPSIIFYGFWIDLGIVFEFFLRFCEPNFAKTQNFLNTKREAKSQPRTRQDQTRSNTIKQDQTRSTKGSLSISQQTPPIEREHDMPSPKMRGRRCHAAWRLQSAPGPKAPEACLGGKEGSLTFCTSPFRNFPSYFTIC